MADKAFFEQGEATAERMREYEGWKASLNAAMEAWEAAADELQKLDDATA